MASATDPASLRARAWLEVSDLIDLQLSPLGERAIAALAPGRGDLILDLGCGTGQTVLQLAQQVGPAGQIIGVDIEPLLLERAKRRAADLAQVRFIAGDAAQLQLPEQSIDAVFSRFGVTGFADPVAAFSHLYQLLKPSGRLAFVCWRALEENELDIQPLRAAGLEERADPTPFRFEDGRFIRSVLDASGFRQISIQPHDQPVSSGGMDATLTVLLKVGALGKIIRENPELREMAEHRLRAALARKAVQGRVWLNAAVWIVTATATT